MANKKANSRPREVDQEIIKYFEKNSEFINTEGVNPEVVVAAIEETGKDNGNKKILFFALPAVFAIVVLTTTSFLGGLHFLKETRESLLVSDGFQSLPPELQIEIISEYDEKLFLQFMFLYSTYLVSTVALLLGSVTKISKVLKKR